MGKWGPKLPTFEKIRKNIKILFLKCIYESINFKTSIKFNDSY